MPGQAEPNGSAETDPPEVSLDQPLFDAFAAVARRQPDATALRIGTHSVTYRRLHERATALAAQIQAATVPGAAVATLLRDPIDAACGILACLAARCPCIILNPDHPPARLADILTDAGAGGLILPPNIAPPILPYALTQIALPQADPDTTVPDVTGSAARTALATPPSPTPNPAHPDSPLPDLQDAPCLIIYTSGSTGRPKGIVRSQRQMAARAGHRIGRFRLTPADRMLLFYPLSSGPGVTGCLAALLSGGALHLANLSATGARSVLDVARDVGITTISGVPALLRMLFALDGAGAAFAHLRSVYTSSESLLRQDVEAWRSILPSGCLVRIGYGLTEGAPLADWFVPSDLHGMQARLPIGYPIPWHDFAITDAAGAPVPDGQPGELWARGRLLSLGEWRQGRCLPGRLLSDPIDPAGAILRTGDLVRRRSDGLLEFLGRSDAQIRVRGNRVEPAELELALRQAPEVAAAAILARPTAGDPVLVAFVVPADPMKPPIPGATPAQPRDAQTAHTRDDADTRLRDTLIAHLRATLPPYMLPARLHLIAAIPTLPGGKVDPGALERFDDAAARHDVPAPRAASAARGPLSRLRRFLGVGSQ
jgi:acyl-CoA synthetase (AMP-forming)/AMP-acid ligase II